jgi:hypothetical protein
MSISKVEKCGCRRCISLPTRNSLDDEELAGLPSFSMRLAGRLTSGVALAITVCWALALAFSGSTDVLLFLAPALLLVAPLVAGRYVGETLIAKLATRRSGPRRRPLAPGASTPPAATLWLPRGTRLLAFSLAKRPPPARLLAIT